MREWRLRVKDQQEASESAPRDHFWLELGFWRVDCDLYGSGMSEEGGGGMWRYGSDLFRVMVVLLWNMEHQSSSNIYQTKPDRPVQSLILIPRWLLCLKQIIWDVIITTPVCWISSRRSGLCLLLADPPSGYNICYGWGKDKLNIKSAGDCHCKLMSGIMRGHKHWKRQDFLDCSLRWSVAWKGCVAFNLWSEWLYSSPFISHIIKLILRFKSTRSAWLIVNNGWEEMMTAWLELVVVISILFVREHY